MKIAKRLKSLFYEAFLRPLPMQDFDDYDGYWAMRGTVGPLFRHRYIASQLPPRGRLLDLGCGNGAFLEHIRKVRPGLELVGVDGSQAAVNLVRSNGIVAEVVDLSTPQISSLGKFDYVVVMEVIEHLPYPELLMADILKMRPSICFVTIPNLGYFINRLRLGLAGKAPLTIIQFHIREHLRCWTISDFKYWSRQLGFEVVSYCGQKQSLLQNHFPSLFASQVIYRLRPIFNPERGNSGDRV